MFIELNKFNNYIVVAGHSNDLRRYKVSGDKVPEFFSKHERVVFIGLIECFECYTKHPETGEGGWDIVFVEGVKECIRNLYPNFDCFLCQGYPSDKNQVVEFYSIERDDYPLA